MTNWFQVPTWYWTIKKTSFPGEEPVKTVASGAKERRDEAATLLRSLFSACQFCGSDNARCATVCPDGAYSTSWSTVSFWFCVMYGKSSRRKVKLKFVPPLLRNAAHSLARS